MALLSAAPVWRAAPALAATGESAPPIIIRSEDLNSTRPAAAAPARPQRPMVATEVPVAYRTLDDDGLRDEIETLRNTLGELAPDAEERARLEELVMLLEVRLEQGIWVSDLISEIAAKVVELRGLPLREPIRFRVYDRARLNALLRGMIAEEYPGEELATMSRVWSLFGAIPEGTDLEQAILKLLTEQVAGFYDEKRKTLAVMSQFRLDRSLARIILAHEICHALQDQHFSFSRMPLKDRTNDDRALAMLSVLEGDAVLIMNDFAISTFGAADLYQLLDILQVDQKQLSRTPYFLRQHLLFSYLEGSKFMASVALRMPTRYDEPFRTWPESTEQILHPQKYLPSTYDAPTSVGLPALAERLGEGWKPVFENTMGEFQIRTVFEVWREWDQAESAAAGWGGDRFAVFERERRMLLVWATTWDTERDAEEFFRAWSELLRSRRYRAIYGDQRFEGGANERVLRPLDVMELGPAAPYLRLVRQGKSVVVFHAEEGSVVEKLTGFDAELFRACGEAASDSPADDEGTTATEAAAPPAVP